MLDLSPLKQTTLGHIKQSMHKMAMMLAMRTRRGREGRGGGSGWMREARMDNMMKTTIDDNRSIDFLCSRPIICRNK